MNNKTKIVIKYEIMKVMILVKEKETLFPVRESKVFVMSELLLLLPLRKGLHQVQQSHFAYRLSVKRSSFQFK